MSAEAEFRVRNALAFHDRFCTSSKGRGTHCCQMAALLTEPLPPGWDAPKEEAITYGYVRSRRVIEEGRP